MKWVIRILIILAVLFVALFIAAQIIINRPFFREKITTIISEQIHRDVKLSGLGLSFFPSVSLNLKELAIFEKNRKDVFVSLDTLRVKVQLLPLLKKQVVVNEIVLDKPKAHVERNAQGEFNFSDMISSAAPVAPATLAPAQAKTQSPSQKGTSMGVSIDTIRINGAEFSYKQTMASGEVKTFVLKGLDVAIDEFSLEKPVLIKVESAFGENAKFSFKGKVGPIAAPVDQMEADLDVLLEKLNSKDLEAFIPTDVLQGKGFENLTVKGKLGGSLSKGISGDLNVSMKVLPINKEIVVKTAFAAKMMEEVVLKELTLTFGPSLRVSMKGKVSPLNVPADQMKVDLEMDISGINTKELAPLIPEESLGGLAVENLTIKGKVKGSLVDQIAGDLGVSLKVLPANKEIRLKGAFTANKMDEFILSELSLNVGTTDLLLKGKIKNLNAPKFEFNFNSNLINADDFLSLMPSSPAKTETKASESSAKTETKAAEAPVQTVTRTGPENPLYGNEKFQNTQGTFVAELKKVQYKANILTDVVLKVKLDKGLLSIESFSVNAFGGKLTGAKQVDLRNEKIGYEANFDMSGILLQEVSKANLGEEKIKGTLAGKASVKGVGLSKADLEKTLTGNANVGVKEGVILGSNLKAEILAKMDNPLLVKMLPGLQKIKEEEKKKEEENAKKGIAANQTPFKDLIVDLALGNGKATLQKMNLTTNDFTVRGDGQVDFSLQANLKTQIVFSKELTEAMTNKKDLSNNLPYENGGLLIPAVITGPITKPTVLPDFEKILANLAKGQLKDKVGSLFNKGDKKGDQSNPLSQVLGGGSQEGAQGQGAGSETSEASKRSNPLGQILGGGAQSSQTEQTQTSQPPTKKSPLGNILGGGDDSQNKQGESEKKSPLDKFKLF